MPKKLIMINGTMGSGKSACCRELSSLLDADWLDGDWCWRPEPLCLADGKKELALRNISLLLRYYLTRSARETVVFCWVMHRQEIIDSLMERLSGVELEPCFFTLLPCREELIARLEKDVEAGAREPVIIGRALDHLPGYAAQNTVKIDNSHLTPRETAEKIMSLAAIRQQPA